MKRCFAVVLAAIILLLCGCSNKVDEAQKLLDSGYYHEAIDKVDNVLPEIKDAELAAKAREIKAGAIYKLQKEAYEDGLWEKSIMYYKQMIDEGENAYFMQISQKLYLVTRAEELLDSIHICVENDAWDDVIDYCYQTNQLFSKSPLSYGEYDEVNIRMDEIEKETKEYLNIAQYNIELERAAKEEEIKSAIRIDDIWTSKPDFLGGVKLYINFTNISEKTIKYITFGVQLYNAVGDIVKCQLTDSMPGDTYGCHYTGPCEKGCGLQGTEAYYGKYYNSTIDHAKLVSVEIEYMDGTEIEIDGDDIELVQY